jgi:acetyl-CoA C-acetyltransferase
MADATRIPVIVGVGQICDRPETDDSALDTLGLMQAALHAADADAGGGLLAGTESLGIEDQMSWDVVAWPSEEKITKYLVEALGVKPAIAYATARPSGDGPVKLINDAANRIGAGEISIAAVVGGEALRTAAKRVAAKVAAGAPPPKNLVRENEEKAASPFRIKYGITSPTDVYPLYECGTRAAWGQSFAEAQAESGALWAGFSQAAADNPFAWIRKPHTAEQIITPTPDNRMIAFPYTKLMVANSSVNMGAALIITSLAKAREIGIAEDRIVYIGPGAAAHEPPDILARDNFTRSPGMIVSLETTLALNNLRAEELDYVELYSCFPCVPKMARRVLNWPLEKLPSVYGGLTFGGGPIGNCMMHAAAAMVEKLRVSGTHGLVFANGGFATNNHSIILTRRPVPAGTFPQSYDFQSKADAMRRKIPPLDETYTGPGTIEAYTIPYDRTGHPQAATIIALAPTGARFVCIVPKDDTAGIEFLTSGAEEPVGTTGTAVKAGDFVVWRRPLVGLSASEAHHFSRRNHKPMGFAGAQPILRQMKRSPTNHYTAPTPAQSESPHYRHSP